jgi:SAM-dependent methyltransferase
VTVTRLVTQLATPPRRYDAEQLEDPTLDRAIVLRSLRDIRRSNLLFGGRIAAAAEMGALFGALPAQATLLDVGTGLGDVPAHVARVAKRHGITMRTIGVDAEAVLAAQAQPFVAHSICASGLELPFATRSVDIVMCSQVLHHFRGDDARALLRELNRVARVAVVISDLRRCWIAAAGFWLASFPLGFHRVTRHDGVVSVMRGFTDDELASTIEDAVSIRPAIRHRLGFRVTTHWRIA